MYETGGSVELRFNSPKVQMHIGHVTTPDGRRTLREALSQTPVREVLLQTKEYPVNCGLLHDIMFLERDKFRDLYDVLQMEMKLTYEECSRLQKDHDLQILVRDEAMTHSTVVPPIVIGDCDIADW